MSDENENENEESTDEILASIRRVISKDADSSDKTPAGDKSNGAPEESENDNEVLVLTEMVEGDGRVVTLGVDSRPANETKDAAGEPASTSAPPSPEASSPAEKAENEPTLDTKEAEKSPASDLVSKEAASTTSESLSRLAETIANKEAEETSAGLPLGPGKNDTLEDLVRELIRPMLREWLDQNLPAIVERVVRKEIQRIVRDAEE